MIAAVLAFVILFRSRYDRVSRRLAVMEGLSCQ